MKTSNDGFQQCYNAQVAVDGAHQLVVATEVTANASDQGGVPAVDALAETVGEQPETVLADAGQRAGSGGIGPGGEGGQAPRPGEVSRDESHGREAVEAGGPCGVCRTLAVGGSQPGSSTCWDSDALRGLAKVQGEWDLVCLAFARPDGGVTRGE